MYIYENNHLLNHKEVFHFLIEIKLKITIYLKRRMSTKTKKFATLLMQYEI